MSLPEVKFQLKKNGKLAFLEQIYEIMSNKFELEDDSRDGAYKFFKALAISNSFMACSRVYEIYRLNLKVYGNDEDPTEGLTDDQTDDLKFLCSSEKGYCKYLGLDFRLSFVKAQRLLRFLMPSFFGIHYENENLDNVPFNQTRELISITNGKIGLFFSDVPSDIRFLELVRSFAQRLNELECDAVVFEDAELPKMTLDTCGATKLKNTDQLTKILRHDMKKLELVTCSEQYLRNAAFNPNAERTDIIRNTTIEEIGLSVQGCNHADQLEIVTDLLPRCPNLKEFGIETSFSAERRDFEYIVEQVLIHRAQMNEMNLRLGLLSKKSLRLHVEFNRESNQEYDHFWFELLKGHFTDWSIEQGYFYDRDTGSNEFYANLCREDQGCSLSLHINLSWLGERDEGLAMQYLSDDSDMDADYSDFSTNSEGCGDQL